MHMARLATALLLAFTGGGALAQDGAADPEFGDGIFGPGRVVVPFNTGGDDTDTARAVAVDGQGRIVAVGNVTLTSTGAIGVVRLLANGQPDPDFDFNGSTIINIPGQNVLAHAVDLQDDGGILIAGYVQNDGDRDFLVIRLLANGTLDTGFGNAGMRTIAFNAVAAGSDQAYAITTTATGKIVVAGSAGLTVVTSRMALARLTASGALDITFSNDGRADFAFSTTSTSDRFHRVAALADDRLLLAGYSDSAGNQDFAVVRVLANGAFDAEFGNIDSGRSLVAFDLGGGSADSAFDVDVDPSGSIFVGGTAYLSSGEARFAVAKLGDGGVLDATFFGGGRQTISFEPDDAAYAVCSSIAVQSDGAILLGGQAARPGVSFDFANARLLTNGTLDTSFGSGGRQMLGFDLGGNNTDNGSDMAFAQGRIVMAGGVQRTFNAGADRDFGITRQVIDLLFTDDFE